MWFIRNYIEKKRGDCFAFIEPLDVLIKEQVGEPFNTAADTVVKPDGFVICNRDKVTYETSFRDTIPVWIYNGDLQIDFKDVTGTFTENKKDDRMGVRI